VARQHRRAVGGAGIGETGDEGAAVDGGHGAPERRLCFYHAALSATNLHYGCLDAIPHGSVA
jgi:hypothetical protein